MEGQSFAGVLRGETDRCRNHVYGAYCGGTKPGLRSIKKGRWKLIKYNVLDGAVQETQLFNLEENPHEFLVEHQDAGLQRQLGVSPSPHHINLADQPEYRAKRAELEQLLREQQRELGDPYEL